MWSRTGQDHLNLQFDGLSNLSLRAASSINAPLVMHLVDRYQWRERTV